MIKGIKMNVIFKNDSDLVMYMASLLALAHADGKFLECEQVCLSQLAAGYASQLGIRDFNAIIAEVEKKWMSKDEFRKELDGWQKALRNRPVVARVLAKDMILLGCSDGDYCEVERQMVAEAANRFGVDTDVLKALEDAIEASISAAVRMSEILTNGLPQNDRVVDHV